MGFTDYFETAIPWESTLNYIPQPPDGASLGAQMVKNLPAMWEIWVQSLGWEDPLEESMATHSRVLAGRLP